MLSPVMNVSRNVKNVRWLLAIDSRSTVFAALIGAAFVIVFAVPLSAALNIWIDEAFTLHTTASGPFNAWTQAIQFEAQPPLYFFLEGAWRTIDSSSISFARFPSMLFAATAVAAFVGAAHRIVPRVPPLIVAMLAAFHPLIIWTAVEMRVYALVLLISTVITWTFYDGFLAPTRSRAAQIQYTLASTAGIYSQYYVGFLLLGHMVTLLLVRRSALREYAVSIGAVALFFAPFLPIALLHVNAKGGFVAPVTIVQATHQIADAIFSYILPHQLSWSGLPKIAGFAAAILLLTALVLFGRPFTCSEPVRVFYVQWVVCIATFILVLWFTGAPLDVAGHFIVVLPLSLVAALLFVSALTRMRVALWAATGLLFSTFAIATFWMEYHPPLVKLGEWQRVGATLSAYDRSVPVATFPAELSLPLSWYFPMTTIPIPSAMPFATDYVIRTTLTQESDVSRVLDPITARSLRLWIVTSRDCQIESLGYYNYNCRYLEKYLGERYRLLRNIGFYGARTRLYERIAKPKANMIRTSRIGATLQHAIGSRLR